MPGPHLANSALRSAGSAGRQPDDRADIQVVIRPAVEPPPDAGRQRIVDRRMTERTGDPDARELASVVDLAHHANHRIELEQRQRHGRIVQIDLTRLDRLDHRGRQRAHVDLETD